MRRISRNVESLTLREEIGNEKERLPRITPSCMKTSHVEWFSSNREISKLSSWTLLDTNFNNFPLFSLAFNAKQKHQE